MRARGNSPTATRATCHDGHAIGLDLGATAVRAAVLAVKHRGGDTVVEARTVAGTDLPRGAVVDGAVVDPRAVGEAIDHLWKANRISCRNVILGVAGPQVVVRELQMPVLTASEQVKALPFMARELVAMPLDQVVLDFAPLGPPDPESGLRPGLLVACPRGPVLAAVAAVEAARLRVVRVDLASLALLRSSAGQHLAVEAVVDLGAHLTTVVVHQDGIPRLVRTLSRGGEELTTGLAERLGLPEDGAEEAKRRLGLRSADPVSIELRELVAPLIGELRSSLNYFRTTHAGVRIDRLALTGGGSGLPGLAQLLGDQVGLDCEVVDPRHLLVTSARKRAVVDEVRATALSVGLAIGAAA